MNLTPYMQALQKHDVKMTMTRRLLDVAREANRLRVTTGTDYGDLTTQAVYDHVVVNYGTRPLDDLYFDLRAGSRNRGQPDQGALVAGAPQELINNPEGTYQLFRSGDAVASRNMHAAIYDALRPCHII